MKRVDLIKALRAAGCELTRRRGPHDVYRNPQTGAIESVPRHREVNEHLARQIIRSLTAVPADEDDSETA